MKKNGRVKKLVLNRETLTSLTMHQISGGYTASACRAPNTQPLCATDFTLDGCASAHCVG